MVTKDRPVTAETVADLLRARAADQPDRVGYTFLTDGELDEVGLTYGEADRRSRAIAARIRAAGAAPGSRVILVLPPGLDYVTAFFGCLYAGAVAVPVYPPDPLQLERTLPRLQAIVRDADATVALTTVPLLGYLDTVAALAPELGALRWLPVDDGPDAPDGPDAAVVSPDAVAFLQYTSGSTAAPKGVLLSHANLLHNLALIQRFFATSADTRALVWLPPYHDMGLIGGLLQPLYAGCPVTLMSPLHFLEEPMRWLRAVDRLRATATGGPNFAYELCLRRADPEQVARLDLSCWQVAFNGAEPIRPQTLERFARTFAPSGFRRDAFLRCYGLAEATLIVSGAGGRRGTDESADPPVVWVDRVALRHNDVASPGGGPAVDLISCGFGAADQRIAIVDPATAQPCPTGRVGEIWVAGPSVARGYWRNPEETARVFGARIAGEEGGPFLRTGDLGFLHDSGLVVTGRLKDLIIVRGRNHYPQDIELSAERADPVLRTGCTAAFQLDATSSTDGAEDGPDDGVVVVVEVRRTPEPVDVEEVGARIRQAVARDHGLQVHTVVLVAAGGVPKTSSGKVQRRLCRTRFRSGDLPEIARAAAAPGDRRAATSVDAGQVVVAPPHRRRALLERYLQGVVGALVDVDPAAVDPREPLLAVGLDSVAVVTLKHRLEADLGLDQSLTALLAGATLAEVVDRLDGQLAQPTARPAASAASAAPAAAGPVQPTSGVARMTHGQRWIWLVHQIEPESTAFTIAVALRLFGPVDRSALRRALDAVVARHPVLRTTFTVRGGEAVQVVHPDGRAAYREHDVPGVGAGALTGLLTADACRPFDLARGPLLRAALYRHDGGEVLLLAMHHIVTDFWSCAILARELGAYYTAYASGRDLVLAAPRATFLDVCAWRQRVLEDPARVARLERYWARQLGEQVPRLGLPVAAPSVAGRGGMRSFAFTDELTRRLRARAARENVTLYVLLLAAFQSVLHLAGDQSDLVVGAAVAGRTRPEFADVVGCCTTTVLIRSRAAGDEPFRALLARARDQVIGALEHQDIHLTVLAQRHRTDRRGPLMDVLFAFNRSPVPGDDLAALATVGPRGVRRSLGSLEVEAFPLALGEGGLPLEVVIAEVGQVPHGVLRYRCDFLDELTVDRLVESFLATLSRVADDPDVPLAALSAPVPAES